MAEVLKNRHTRRLLGRNYSKNKDDFQKRQDRWLKTCSWALGKSEFELNYILSNPKTPVKDYPGSDSARMSGTDIDAIKTALKEIKSKRPTPINPEDDCC